MSNRQKKVKTREWLTRECWLELFGESITELPDRAERIMVLMVSLGEMIKGNYEEREAACRAVQNCVEACIPYTRAQILAEKTVSPNKRL